MVKKLFENFFWSLRQTFDRTRYRAVFWDIDGTLYNDSVVFPEAEKDLFSFWNRFDPKSIKGIDLKFWKAYDGLIDIVKKFPKERQGVITNGYDLVQKDKLKILGCALYINPDLVYTCYGEAEKILNQPGHPLEGFAYKNGSFNIDNLIELTGKPRSYMFERALERLGYDSKYCVMIGDFWTDIVAANKVGMKTIFIDGVRSKQDNEPLYRGKVVPDFVVMKGDTVSLENLLFK